MDKKRYKPPVCEALIFNVYYGRREGGKEVKDNP
jgi:hypothetical protein